MAYTAMSSTPSILAIVRSAAPGVRVTRCGTRTEAAIRAIGTPLGPAILYAHCITLMRPRRRSRARRHLSRTNP